MDKKTFKKIVYLIAATALFAVIVIKIDPVAAFLSNLLKTMSPLFVGIAIAFILNKPYCFIRKLYLKKAQKKRTYALMSGLAVVSVYVLFLGIITGIVAFIIPQLVESVSTLVSNMDNYTASLSALIEKVIVFLQLQQIDLSSIESYLQNFLSGVGDFLTVLMPQIYNFTAGLFSSIFNTILGLIISVYLLSSKEKILVRMKKTVYAYLPKQKADRFTEIGHLTADTFSRFVNGQLTEALILGVLCFVGMAILGFQYPLFISTIIAVTSIIPMIGAVIGCIPAVFILLLVDPMMAVWFIVYIVVLQQIESNTFYPKVAGDSVGLPAVLVILAVIIGGGIGGILGMLIGVPLASVIYRLLKEDTEKKLALKKVPE